MNSVTLLTLKGMACSVIMMVGSITLTIFIEKLFPGFTFSREISIILWIPLCLSLFIYHTTGNSRKALYTVVGGVILLSGCSVFPRYFPGLSNKAFIMWSWIILPVYAAYTIYRIYNEHKKSS